MSPVGGRVILVLHQKHSRCPRQAVLSAHWLRELLTDDPCLQRTRATRSSQILLHKNITPPAEQPTHTHRHTRTVLGPCIMCLQGFCPGAYVTSRLSTGRDDGSSDANMKLRERSCRRRTQRRQTPTTAGRALCLL